MYVCVHNQGLLSLSKTLHQKTPYYDHFKQRNALESLLKIRQNYGCPIHAPICYTVADQVETNEGNLKLLKRDVRLGDFHNEVLNISTVIPTYKEPQVCLY